MMRWWLQALLPLLPSPYHPAAILHRTSASPFNVTEACAPERREATVRGFGRDFALRGWAGRVRRAFAAVEGPVVLAVGESRTNLIFHNFVLKLQQMLARDDSSGGGGTGAREGQTLVYAALDGGGFEKCLAVRALTEVTEEGQRLRLVCLDLTGWLPEELFDAGADDRDRNKNGASPLTCEYNVMIWTKPHILAAAVEASAEGVLLTDTDVILYHDPIKLCKEVLSNSSGKVLVTASEFRGAGLHPWGVNTGTVFASQKSLDILKLWAEQEAAFINMKGGDQAALQHILHQRRTVLEGVEKLPTSMIGQCGQKGKFGTHYNCYGSKRLPMKRKGDWERKVESNLAAGSQPAQPEKDEEQDSIPQLSNAAQQENVLPEEDVAGRMSALRAGDEWLLDK